MSPKTQRGIRHGSTAMPTSSSWTRWGRCWNRQVPTSKPFPREAVGSDVIRVEAIPQVPFVEQRRLSRSCASKLSAAVAIGKFGSALHRASDRIIVRAVFGTNTFDKVAAIEQWMTQGRAPDRSSPHTRQKEESIGPAIVPYPHVAVYDGCRQHGRGVSSFSRVEWRHDDDHEIRRIGAL